MVFHFNKAKKKEMPYYQTNTSIGKNPIGVYHSMEYIPEAWALLLENSLNEEEVRYFNKYITS